MSFKLDSTSLLRGLQSLESKSEVAMRAFAETGALKMQSYAQQNAPWTDRTGAARQRLKGSVQRRENAFRIQIAHGVDYGIWLEFAHEKRFAILPDTIRIVGQEKIMPSFEKFLERL